MRKALIGLVVAANLLVVGVLVHRYGGRAGSAAAQAGDAWSALSPAARCDSAAQLVRLPNPWPTVCTWRDPTASLRGLSFPPPVGDPPYDHPHIEIFVAPSDTRAEVAHAIAHEMGHMHHTRAATFGPQWLQARGLQSDTPPTVWTEDYAEVFATLYGPPVEGWQAPTTRPSPTALASLQAEFFSPP